MLPIPYRDLVAELDAQSGSNGFAEKVESMGAEDAIAMLFSHIRSFVAKTQSKDKLNQYLDYGLKSYDSAVLSGVIDNDLLDNTMIAKISEEFGVWETIHSMVAANQNAEEAVLYRVIEESQGLSLCILAARLQMSYDIFLALVNRNDKNANRVLLRRFDIPEEWKIIIALSSN